MTEFHGFGSSGMRRVGGVLAAMLLATAAVPATAAEGTLVVAVNQEPQDLAAQGAYKEINAPGLRNVIETLIAADPVSELGMQLMSKKSATPSAASSGISEGEPPVKGTPSAR